MAMSVRLLRFNRRECALEYESVTEQVLRSYYKKFSYPSLHRPHSLSGLPLLIYAAIIFVASYVTNTEQKMQIQVKNFC